MLLATVRRKPSGSGRHSRIQGAESTISGGATISSRRCWVMCARKSESARSSSGVSSAITIVSEASVERGRAKTPLQPRRRAPEPGVFPPSQYSTADPSTRKNGGCTGQAAALVRLGTGQSSEEVEDDPGDDPEHGEEDPVEGQRLEARRGRARAGSSMSCARRCGSPDASPGAGEPVRAVPVADRRRQRRLEPEQRADHEEDEKRRPAEVDARIAAVGRAEP